MAPTKWRLKLKRGVKFHNGEPFDAEAVIYSVKVFRETKGLARGWFGFLAGAEKVDDYTVDLVTSQPTAIVPSSLAFLYVFPPKYHGQVGSEGFAKKPVGTGAWRFVSWTPGVQFKVEPNPDYWGKKPAVGEIHFRWAAGGVEPGGPPGDRARYTWPRTFRPRSPSGSSARVPRVSRR